MSNTPHYNSHHSTVSNTPHYNSQVTTALCPTHLIITVTTALCPAHLITTVRSPHCGLCSTHLITTVRSPQHCVQHTSIQQSGHHTVDCVQHTSRGCGACSFVLEVSAELQGIQISSRTRSALCNAIRVLRVGASMPAEKVGCLCLRRVFFLRVH